MAGRTSSFNQSIIAYQYYETQSANSPENGGFVIVGDVMIHDGPDDLAGEIGIWGGAGRLEVCGPNGFTELKKFIFDNSGSTESDVEVGLEKYVASGMLKFIMSKTMKPKVVEVPNP